MYSKTQCPIQPAWTRAVKNIRFSVNGLNISFPLNATDFSLKMSFTISNSKCFLFMTISWFKARDKKNRVQQISYTDI